jgi:subtilisin family serine protease
MFKNVSKSFTIFFISSLIVILAGMGNSIFAQSEIINGREFVFANGKWYQIDNETKYEVIQDVITVKFKDGANESQINSLLQGKNSTALRKNELGYYDLEIPEKSDALTMVKEFLASPILENAEPNTYGKYTSNDTYYSNQWNLTKINGSQAWNIETGHNTVIIGVIDTGVDYNHEDLSGNMWTNSNDPINGIDDDGNGKTDDYYGWDFYYNDRYCNRGSHGTACIGIAAAITNNSKGIAGVTGGWYGTNQGSRIIALGIRESDPDGSILDDAILYAVQKGAKVITLSLNVGETSAINNAISTAINTYDCFINCASGNGNTSVAYPASHSLVCAVGATDQSDNRWGYSNYGSTLDVVAPSGGSSVVLYTTDVTGNGGYNTNQTSGELSDKNYTKWFSGTSAASPHVGGLAALIRSKELYLTASQVKTIIEQSADDKGASGFDNYYGWGRINAWNALRITTSGTLPGSEVWRGTITITGNVTVPAGKQLTILGGTTVNFSGSSYITVQPGGSIVASSPITFNPGDRSVRYSGTMSVNNSWGFPVLLTDNVTINTGKVLTILPGSLI